MSTKYNSSRLRPTCSMEIPYSLCVQGGPQYFDQKMCFDISARKLTSWRSCIRCTATLSRTRKVFRSVVPTKSGEKLTERLVDVTSHFSRLRMLCLDRRRRQCTYRVTGEVTKFPVALSPYLKQYQCSTLSVSAPVEKFGCCESANGFMSAPQYI